MKMKRFSRAFFAIALSCAIFMTGAAAAEEHIAFQVPSTSSKEAPQATSAGYIAMLYSKMTGKRPNLEGWATASKDYTAASKFDKVTAQREKISELQAVYDLLTPTEPVVVDIPVVLSSYSKHNQGFFIDSFKEDTFFGFEFMDTNYAVIPMNLMEYQWLKVPAEQADRIFKTVQPKAKDMVRAILYVDPIMADRNNPLNMDGTPRWMISGEVRKLMLYTTNGYLLWETADKKEAEALSLELLNLKQ